MMNTLFESWAIWFTVPALLGTGFLLLQLLLGQLGGDLDADVDLDIDFDADFAADNPGAEFKLLSLQTLAAFALGFGWMGLAAYRFIDVGFTGAVFIGIGSGFAVAWFLVLLSKSVMKLQSSGNIYLSDLHGRTGEVYIQIPPANDGHGRVKLAIKNSTYEYNAIQDSAVAIPSRTRVRVTGTNQATNTVTVEPVI